MEYRKVNFSRCLLCFLLHKTVNFWLSLRNRLLSAAWKVSLFGFLWSMFSHIRTEYGQIQSISPYSVQMRKNGSFSRNVRRSRGNNEGESYHQGIIVNVFRYPCRCIPWNACNSESVLWVRRELPTSDNIHCDYKKTSWKIHCMQPKR